MKIVTVNVPESYIDAIEKLIGDKGLYPSRSELIRVAVRDFLLREMKNAEDILKWQGVEEEEEEEEIEVKNNDEEFVRVPVKKENDVATEFKTYKIIKRLEYGNSACTNEITNRTMDLDDEDDFTLEESEFPSFEEIEKMKPSIQTLRNNFPTLPDYKFMNEP